MTFLVWYGHGARARSTSQYGEMSRFFSLIICTCLPLAWALFVAASRLVDHWHHPSDVLAGLGLGLSILWCAIHPGNPPSNWGRSKTLPLARQHSPTRSRLRGSNVGCAQELLSRPSALRQGERSITPRVTFREVANRDRSPRPRARELDSAETLRKGKGRGKGKKGGR